MPKQWKIASDRVWIDQGVVGFGVTAMTAFARELACPVVVKGLPVRCSNT